MVAKLLPWTERLAYGAFAAIAGSVRAVADSHLRNVFFKLSPFMQCERGGAARGVAGARRDRLARRVADREALRAVVVQRGRGRVDAARVPIHGGVDDPVLPRDCVSLLQRRDVRERVLRGFGDEGSGTGGYDPTDFMKIRNMEAIFWIPVFVAFCVPASRVGALQVVHLWMDSRGIIRELYDPIIARLKSAHSESLAVAGDDDDAADERAKRTLTKEWHHGRSDAARLGFAIVFGYLLQLPFIGPLTWFLGFVAAGMFAPELIELQVFARRPKTDKAL
ncbi:hypothetical protein FI667_g8145, partial [Globisporangium splendens]